jgi:hypothetical protein
MLRFPSVDEIFIFSNELNVHLIHSFYEGDYEQTVHISKDNKESIKDILKLSIAKNDNIAFIRADKFDSEDYIVSIEDITLEENGQLYKRILKEAKEYNKKVVSKENEIYVIELFFVLEGIKYSLIFFEEWVDDFLSEDFFDQYQEELSVYRRECVEQISNEEKERQKSTNEVFITLLMSDKLLELCSNKQAKIARFKELANEHQNEYFLSMPKTDLEGYIDLLLAKKKTTFRKIQAKEMVLALYNGSVAP